MPLLIQYSTNCRAPHPHPTPLRVLLRPDSDTLHTIIKLNPSVSSFEICPRPRPPPCPRVPVSPCPRVPVLAVTVLVVPVVPVVPLPPHLLITAGSGPRCLSSRRTFRRNVNERLRTYTYRPSSCYPSPAHAPDRMRVPVVTLQGDWGSGLSPYALCSSRMECSGAHTVLSGSSA